MDQSAVIDLEGMDGGGKDTVGCDTAGSHGQSSRQGLGSEDKSYVNSMKQSLQENVTQMMWQSGTQKAKSVWTVYANIDFLRPYFSVEPHEVRTRLLYSLIPERNTGDVRRTVVAELYGPLMVVFSLIALLLFQMKTADHRVEEGTLMGTAFGVCFTYWLGTSAFTALLSYVCNVHLSIIQILSMVGYGLFGHCIVMLLGTVIHTAHDHLLFYILWAILGGLATLRMVSIVSSRTHGHTQRFVVCGVLAAIHLLFLLYLHFAFHQIVEDLSHVFSSHDDWIAVQPKNSDGENIAQMVTT